MKNLLVYLLILSISFCTYAQSDLNNKFNNKFIDYKNNHPIEKAYLHLDKSIYTTGEDIWFKAYIVDGTFHQPTMLSTLLYVELVSPQNEVIAVRNIKIDEGVGSGDFSIADSLQGGDYIVRAYTGYMKNTDLNYMFRQKIKVININTSVKPDTIIQGDNFTPLIAEKNKDDAPNSAKIDVQFFPEGGHMIDALANNIAFKSINTSGQSIRVSGNVMNSKDEIVASFKAIKFGMGKFVMVPKEGETYTAQVDYRGNKYKFKLPISKPTGYLMTLRKSGNKISITVNNNKGVSMKNAFLIGHIRGIIFKSLSAVDDRDYLHFTIPIDSIPSGIAHFTFFDQDGSPRTERVFYSNNKMDKSSLEIRSTKPHHTNRENTEFTISLSDFKKQPLQGNVSISIVNKETATKGHKVASIQSYLLLASDIKGHIENPDYYFDENNKDRYAVLDLLMLTQGWRKFTWNEILQDTCTTPKYQPEKGFRISGQLLNQHNREKPLAGNVTLNSIDDLSIVETITTSEDGLFSFENLDINDSLTLILQASKIASPKKREGKEVKTPKRNQPIFISLDVHQSPEIKSVPSSADVLTHTDTLGYFNQSRKIRAIDSAFFVKKGVRVLDEVKISGIKDPADDPYYRVNQPYRSPTQRLILDSIRSVGSALSIFDIIRSRVPGLSVRGSFPFQSAVFRGMKNFTGSSQALIVLDGMPIDSVQANQVPPKEISHIDILKGASAATYGIRGGNGVIVLYTKKYSFRKPPSWMSLGITDLKHSGYYKAKNFYTPKYDNNSTINVKPDFRNTLYWNPEVLIDGKKMLSFYTSDEKATYLIQIEGISPNGQVISGKSYFHVE